MITTRMENEFSESMDEKHGLRFEPTTSVSLSTAPEEAKPKYEDDWDVLLEAIDIMKDRAYSMRKDLNRLEDILGRARFELERLKNKP